MSAKVDSDRDPAGRKLPIKLDAASNGEFAPIPLDETLQRANALASDWADAHSRKLGVRNICIHKGLPFGRKSYEHSTCRDVGPIAKRFPDMNFLIYHSGYVAGQEEGPRTRREFLNLARLHGGQP